jgi:hypothetical protein
MVRGCWNMQVKARKRLLSNAGIKPIHTATISCLFALILQVILPIVHFSHISREELRDRISRPCTYHERASEEAQALTSGPKEAQNHSHHDCCSCPICQYLFGVRNIFIQDKLIGSMVFEPVELLAVVRENPNTSPCPFTTYRPRSPPSCLEIPPYV